MAQFSMEIMRLTGSVLRGNQHTLEALPENRRNIGWANQLTHARVRYENIVKALGTEPGMQVFPDGTDLSVTAERKAGTTIIDTMKRLRDLDD